MPRFDTHATVQQLQAHGLTATQAEGITTALVSVLDATGQTVATKADLETVRTALTTDLEATRTALTTDLEATRTALKTDLETVRTALKTDLDTQGAALRSEIRELRILMESRFQTIDARFLFTHWMIGIAFTVLLGFSLGNLWLLVNLFARLPRP